jgi:demethylmenaquinone methyltransferase/2-methoxy-6-polyprenyl-1,4-benzoquinol methylase
VSFFRWTAPIFKLSRHRWRDSDFRAIAQRLRPFVPTGGKLLDLGGGTGDLGLGVGRVLGAEVIVADVTPQMLRRVSGDPSITVRLTSAEALPFPDGYFDAVLVSDAFHHFSDLGAAAGEIARVVRPAGAVLVLEFRPGPGGVLALFERLLGEPGAFMEPEQLRALLAGRGIEGIIAERGLLTYTFFGRKTSAKTQ